MKNAAQAMPHGGTLNISGEAVTADNIVRIEFMDTGVGIPPEDLPHVFDEFFRGRDIQRAGAGLGLSIAKRVYFNLLGMKLIKSIAEEK